MLHKNSDQKCSIFLRVACADRLNRELLRELTQQRKKNKNATQKIKTQKLLKKHDYVLWKDWLVFNFESEVLYLKENVSRHFALIKSMIRSNLCLWIENDEFWPWNRNERRLRSESPIRIAVELHMSISAEAEKVAMQIVIKFSNRIFPRSLIAMIVMMKRFIFNNLVPS